MQVETAAIAGCDDSSQSRSSGSFKTQQRTYNNVEVDMISRRARIRTATGPKTDIVLPSRANGLLG